MGLTHVVICIVASVMALATGAMVSPLAKQRGTSRQTIMRARDATPAH